MSFGQKLRKLREEKGVTQQVLATKLGYVTNSYIADVEKGKFIPSKKKLKKIAKALNLPYSQINNLLTESKIEELGIKDSELIRLVRDIPELSKGEKMQLIDVYLKIKMKKR